MQEFGEHPSFSGIRSDCRSIVEVLKTDLRAQFRDAEVTSAELKEAFTLLCKLGEPVPSLASAYLDNHRLKLAADLERLSDRIGSDSSNSSEPIQHFIEVCCNTVLNNVALTIATYHNIFADGPASDSRSWSFGKNSRFCVKIINNYLRTLSRSLK